MSRENYRRNQSRAGEFVSEPFPTEDDIAKRAHELFVQFGRPGGSIFRCWVQAEQELLNDTARPAVRAEPFVASSSPVLRRRHVSVPEPSSQRCTQSGMSYNLTLQCGCIVYVARHPETGIAHTRVIESRGRCCRVRRHEVGLRLYLWEILPDPNYRPRPVFVSKRRRLMSA
jgi:hypothetical protein